MKKVYVVTEQAYEYNDEYYSPTESGVVLRHVCDTDTLASQRSESANLEHLAVVWGQFSDWNAEAVGDIWYDDNWEPVAKYFGLRIKDRTIKESMEEEDLDAVFANLPLEALTDDDRKFLVYSSSWFQVATYRTMEVEE